MSKSFSVDEFRAAAKDGGHPDGVVLRFAGGDPQALADRKIRFTFSDGSVDRAGDVINPAGWQLTNFLKNPVALWSHDSTSPPIGRASNVGVKNGKLVGDIEFANADTYPAADTIFRLVKEKFINACSVGFIPLSWKMSGDKNRPGGIDFLEQELLEISVCPVPCLPSALAEARAKGIDTNPIRAWVEEGDAARQARIIEARKIAAKVHVLR